jgi:hypothetical protein
MKARAVQALVILSVLLGIAVIARATTTASITTASGRSITSIKAVRGDPADAYLAQSDASNANRPWVDIPGASATFTVPAAQRAWFLVTFSAEHRCTGSSPGTFLSESASFGCVVRATVAGVPMLPSAPSVAVGSLSQPSQTVEIEGDTSNQFSSNALGPGTYMVRVQYSTRVANDTIGVEFLIRNYHVTVERVKV